MMDFNFLATANGITSKYFSQEQVAKTASGLSPLDEEAKKKFGEAFSNAYDEMIATKALGENMRNSYENMHQDDFQAHANRLGYSIDNRVIDMLGLQLSDEMNAKVSAAMNSAIDSI